MLRLPPFQLHHPDTVTDAVRLLAEHGSSAMLMAGGTDLIPNMKHRLFEPAHLVSLGRVDALGGVARDDRHLVIGAGESLAHLAVHPLVRTHTPALAEAAAHVAGPQIRNRATLGGNLCLDTRCTYYNQSAFWRGALGFCLKKDGDLCHVTGVGKKCVAAHSADTPPVLMTLDAELEIAGPDGNRTQPVRDFFVADGIRNTRLAPAEVLTSVRIPLPGPGVRMAYQKLRQRHAIDFPLLTVAVAADLDPDLVVRDLVGVVTALGARPRELSGWLELARGNTLDSDLVEGLAQRAFEQCQPLENLIVDAEWRRAMVPVYVRRALERLRA